LAARRFEVIALVAVGIIVFDGAATPPLQLAMSHIFCWTPGH